MTFWSEKSNIIEPVRPYRFRIMDAGSSPTDLYYEEGYWWWAKSVTKPSFKIETIGA